MRVRGYVIIFSVLGGAFFGACSGSNPSPAAAPPTTVTPTSTTTAPAPTTSGMASAPVPPASSPAATRTVSGLEFKRELEVPVHSIGLADPPLVAVLADEPQVRDKRGWRTLPIPAGLKPKSGETENAEIYFGRDNRGRIMGTRSTSAGPVSVYLRWVDAGWREGREEIGRLGNSPRGGLYGVLGLDDPEVVCRAGDVCIIKRLSGWKTIPAGAEPRLVSVRDKTAWSLDSTGVSALGADAWSVFAATPPHKQASAFWADGKEAWVSEGDKLFHFSDGRWTSQPSPVARVAAFWGAKSDRVFAVGEQGIAIWNGTSWGSVTGAPQKLRVIQSRGKDYLWVGGETGLYQVSGQPS